MTIAENLQQVRQDIPEYVTILAAVKTRSAEEVKQAVQAGIKHFGENYVQEAEKVKEDLGEAADALTWHMIGHLQTNKVKKAISLFDVIQTVDSLKLARAINEKCTKPMHIYVEINSGEEPQKSGIMPRDAEKLIRQMAEMHNLRVKGLMTMGPLFGDPEEARPYFQKTRKIFEHVAALNLPNVDLQVLSMGMTNSYQVAIEEGSNMIRLGTILFGERPV